MIYYTCVFQSSDAVLEDGAATWRDVSSVCSTPLPN